MSMFFLTKKVSSNIISQNRSYYYLIGLIILLFLLFSNPAFSWSGFDYEKNTTIEIGSGNLVRENLEITIFDWSTNQYHDVEVITMENSFNGTRLEVFDLETKTKRVFEMED